PPNDDLASATVLVGNIGSTNGFNFYATKENGEPNHAGNAGGSSLWYRWTAPATGPATFTALGSGLDTLLAAYTGSRVRRLTLVASNDDATAGLLQSQLSFDATAGVLYYIALDGYGGDAGPVTLNWGFGAPVN